MKDQLTKKTAYAEAANNLFTAAENIRQSLNMIDLEGLAISEGAAAEIEAAGLFLERIAQICQRAAKGPTPKAAELKELLTYKARQANNGRGIKTGALEIADGVPAVWQEMTRYQNAEGREMARLCSIIELRAEDLRTAEEIAGYMPELNGRKPTAAEAYHAAATKGLREAAEAMKKKGIDKDRGQGSGPAEA